MMQNPLDIQKIIAALMAQGQTPVQAAMNGEQVQQTPQQPVSFGRELGQGVLNSVLGQLFANHNKIDQSEDAPWMSGAATDGIDQSLKDALQKYLGNKLF